MEHQVALLNDLKPNEMKAAKAGEEEIVLFRASDDTVTALIDRCSHANVRLSRGTYDGCSITCPAHGAKFDTKSGVHLCMPAVKGVKYYPVRIADGKIYVTVPE